MRKIVLVLVLAACSGGKHKAAMVPPPASGSAVAAECCCEPADAKARPEMAAPDACKANGGTCAVGDHESDCHGIEGPIP